MPCTARRRSGPRFDARDRPTTRAATPRRPTHACGKHVSVVFQTSPPLSHSSPPSRRASVTSRRVFFSTAPRALRVAIASKPSAAAAGVAPTRQHARPHAPRASRNRSGPRSARARRAARTVPGLAFGLAAGDSDSISTPARTAQRVHGRAISFSSAPLIDRSGSDPALHTLVPTRAIRRWRFPPGSTP